MIREIEPCDLDTIVELNQNALHGVGPLDHESASMLVKMSDQALVADERGDIAGFVITIPPGSDYESSRYEWFEDRFDDYVYLDRIVVSPDYRRRGIASQLYNELETDVPVALEIYDTNDVSRKFHAAHGFEQVGALEHAGKTNLMMVRPPV